jgi:hypothetical protein
MKTICLIVSICLTTTLLAQSDAPKTCSPSTDIKTQPRTAVKHRKTSLANPQQTSVPEILNWTIPAKIGLRQTRTSETTIDDHENGVYIFEGSLWRIGLEGNDCDLHLELADVGKGNKANRVIVEIPKEDEDARNKLLAALSKADRDKLLNLTPDAHRNYRAMNLKDSVHLRVTGLGFFDTHHYVVNWQNSLGGNCKFTPPQVHKRGNNHGTCAVGTVWELHPAWSVEVVQ